MAIIEHIDVQTTESEKSIKSLRGELKELKNQLLNTKEGTEEYNRVLVEAGNVQHQLKEMTEEVNASAMDFGDQLSNATKSLSGVAGAITAATGAMSLFGIENEEAQKKITATMTSLIGITEGLSKMDDGAKAFKRLSNSINIGSKSLGGFKKALIATGLGAIVVVLGSIIANWDKFSKAIGLSTEKMQKLGNMAKGVLNVIKSGMQGIAMALAKMIKGDFKGAWQELKNGFSVAKNFQAGVEQAEKDRLESQTETTKTETAKQTAIIEDAYKKRIEAAQKLAKYEKDMAQARLRGGDTEKYSSANIEIELNYFKTLESLYKKDSDEYKNLMLEKEQWLQGYDEYRQKQKDKELEDINKIIDAEIEATNKQIESESEARQNLLDDFDNGLMTDQQKLDDRYKKLIDAAELEGRDTTEITRWYEQEKTRIIEEESEKQDEIRMAQLQNYATFASNIGDILGSLGDMMGEGTEAQKGFAIAQTTIQTLVGVATALSGVFTSKTGPWDIAIAAAQAASIAASGIASIQKIRAVKKDGAGADVSVPSVSMDSVVASAPDFQQTIDGAMTQTSIRDQRVYVVESDITDAQKKVQVAENNARY